MIKEMVYRIRAALNCLQGNATIYKLHFLKGKVTVKYEKNLNIIRSTFDFPDILKIQASDELYLEDYAVLEDVEGTKC